MATKQDSTTDKAKPAPKRKTLAEKQAPSMIQKPKRKS
jgi:hypothetical protein